MRIAPLSAESGIKLACPRACTPLSVREAAATLTSPPSSTRSAGRKALSRTSGQPKKEVPSYESSSASEAGASERDCGWLSSATVLLFSLPLSLIPLVSLASPLSPSAAAPAIRLLVSLDRVRGGGADTRARVIETNSLPNARARVPPWLSAPLWQ
eukprot:3591110-Pleurochrysis_carterae.AAC.5